MAKESIKFVELTLSGLEEVLNLVSKGMTYEITKATDATDILIVRNGTGANRAFRLKITGKEY